MSEADFALTRVTRESFRSWANDGSAAPRRVSAERTYAENRRTDYWNFVCQTSRLNGHSLYIGSITM